MNFELGFKFLNYVRSLWDTKDTLLPPIPLDNCLKCLKWRNCVSQFSVALVLYQILNSNCCYWVELADENLVEETYFLLDDLGPSSQDSFQVAFSEDVDLLQDNVSSIRTEFELLFGEYQNLWSTNGTSQGKWQICFLVNQGVINHTVVQLCPITWLLARMLPNAMNDCLYGNVAFSVVHPNTEITAHYGPTNSRVRCHVGIQVPPGCSLFVDNEEYRWGQDKCILFDDSKLHSVVNRNDTHIRVVLMVDLWNFEMTQTQRKLMSVLFSPSSKNTFWTQTDCFWFCNKNIFDKDFQIYQFSWAQCTRMTVHFVTCCTLQM